MLWHSLRVFCGLQNRRFLRPLSSVLCPPSFVSRPLPFVLGACWSFAELWGRDLDFPEALGGCPLASRVRFGGAWRYSVDPKLFGNMGPLGASGRGGQTTRCQAGLPADIRLLAKDLDMGRGRGAEDVTEIGLAPDCSPRAGGCHGKLARGCGLSLGRAKASRRRAQERPSRARSETLTDTMRTYQNVQRQLREELEPGLFGHAHIYIYIYTLCLIEKQIQLSLARPLCGPCTEPLRGSPFQASLHISNDWLDSMHMCMYCVCGGA